MAEPTLLEVIQQIEKAIFPMAIDNPGFVRIKVDSQAQFREPIQIKIGRISF